MTAQTDLIKSLITDVPDFPKPGVTFKDITPLLASPAGFKATVDALVTGFTDATPRIGRR